MYGKVIQLYIYTYAGVYFLFLVHYKSLQDTEYISWAI